jgi:hypothetical protein
MTVFPFHWTIAIRPAHQCAGPVYSIGHEEFDQSVRDFVRSLIRKVVAAPRNRAAPHIEGEFLEHRHHLCTEALIAAEAEHWYFERLLLVLERGRMVGGECPSSDDLRRFAVLRNGGSGPPWLRG